MDTKLATLFYVGIIIPTLITITVFLGFLLCLYKRNLRQKMNGLCRRKLPATPSGLHTFGTSNRSFDKFDKCSQHSADSAIDVGEAETSLDEKLAANGMVLDTRCLGKSNHSYQNESMQLTTEVEIHGRSSSDPLLKGYYPTHKKLNEEIHSQVKIYEKMTDVQRVALQLQQKRSDTDKHLVAAAMQKLQADEKTTSRYTSTSKLIPGAPAPNTNQLDKSSNYASYSPSWYAADNQEDNSNVYNNQYPSATSWQPNIAVSCSSNTDNYSSVESSQV